VNTTVMNYQYIAADINCTDKRIIRLLYHTRV